MAIRISGNRRHSHTSAHDNGTRRLPMWRRPNRRNRPPSMRRLTSIGVPRDAREPIPLRKMCRCRCNLNFTSSIINNIPRCHRLLLACHNLRAMRRIVSSRTRERVSIKRALRAVSLAIFEQIVHCEPPMLRRRPPTQQRRQLRPANVADATVDIESHFRCSCDIAHVVFLIA